MKQIESDCLLRLHSGPLYAVFSDIADTNIAAAPEIVQVLHLGAKQLLESLVHYPIQCPLSTPAEFFGRSRLRRVINHVFGQADRTTGVCLDREGNSAKVLRVSTLVGVRARGLQYMVKGAHHRHATLFGPVA